MSAPKRSAVLAASLIAATAIGACSSKSANDDPNADWPVDPETKLRVADMGPVPPLPNWPDNPVTPAKTALGKALFSDARLSGSGKTACSNCHFPFNDFQSGGPKDVPDRSYPGIAPTLPRNTPSLNDYVYATMARWDGSYFTNLFDVAALPLAEANMNTAGKLPPSAVEEVDLDDAKQALFTKLTTTAPGYVKAYADAFGQDIRTRTPDAVWSLTGKALAAYLRIAVSRDAPFDRWNAGDDEAMSVAAVRGLALFRGRAHCATCHSGPMFTDYKFHNIGTAPPGADGTRPDEGRAKVTHADADRGAFLTPTLRSAAATSPYLHDGSEVSLSKVIARKMSAQTRGRDPNHDPALDLIPPLSDAEVNDLVAFVEALRGAELSPDVTAPPATLP